MKSIISLFLFTLLLSCQSKTEYSKTEVVEPSTTKAKDTIVPDVSKVESIATAVEQTTASPSSIYKINENLNQLDNETAKTITTSLEQNGPTFRLDTMNEWFTNNLKRYLDLSCENKYKGQMIFNHNFNKSYDNSYDKTKKMDGAIFCLRDITTEPYLAKLIYNRNEGGHSTDQVYLLTISSSRDKIYTLPLSYEIAWDGEGAIFESQIINDHLINRKVTVRFGDSNTHPDSLAKQARKETFQSFRIMENGEMEMISSEVKKYNMDKYIGG